MKFQKQLRDDKASEAAKLYVAWNISLFWNWYQTALSVTTWTRAGGNSLLDLPVRTFGDKGIG